MAIQLRFLDAWYHVFQQLHLGLKTKEYALMNVNKTAYIYTSVKTIKIVSSNNTISPLGIQLTLFSWNGKYEINRKKIFSMNLKKKKMKL